MTQSKRLLAMLFGSLLLAACGGGGDKCLGDDCDNGGGGGGETTTPELRISTYSCTDAANNVGCTSTIQLPAEKTNRVQVTLVDGDGKAIANTAVSATTDVGTLSPAKALTDSSGVAVFLLKAPEANTSGAGTITASYTGSDSSTISSSLSFAFVPGQTSSDDYQLSLRLMVCDNLSDLSTCSEQSRLPTERASLIEATLLNPSGSPVAGEIINATATQGAITPSSALLTDDDGKAIFQLTSTASSAETAGRATVSTTVETGDLSASKNYQFGASDLNISLTSDKTTLSAGSVAVLTATVTQNGAAYNYPIEITFSSSCASANKATLDTQVTAQQGTAISTYKGTTDNYACSGNDTITASAAGLNDVATVIINNITAETRSISAATPKPEFIYLRGSGKDEKATVTFTLLDAQAKPVSGKQLNFSFGGNISNNVNYQDYSLSPLTATTNKDGQATVTVNAGNLPTPISVIAVLDGNTEIRAASSQIGVGIGYADDNSFSFAADKYNINGAAYDGEEAKITLHLADRFNNPVADGTKVYFTTEGGSIKGDLTSASGDATGVCSTKSGVCTATLTSQDPRPADGRVTVSAYVAGEESFKDLNGNGIFDKGELQGVADDDTIFDVPDYVRSYKDVGERFTDKNIDDTIDDSGDNSLGDADHYLVNVDKFEDLNANGVRDLGDGVYTGLICDKDTITRGFCKRELTTLFRNVEFIFTGVSSSDAGDGAMPLQVYDAASGTWRSDIVVDLTDNKSKFVRILPMHIPHDETGDKSEGWKNPVPTSLGDAANFGDLNYNALRGVNPMPAGSIISTSNNNGGDVTSAVGDGTCSHDAKSPYPSITRPIFYCFQIDPETSGNKKTEGLLNITIKSTGTHQDGLTRSVTVWDNG